jgi:nucleotide-binding universal stress UspA family protein
MYTRILVPVDGSPTSNRGLDEAIRLARLTGARIKLVNVVDDLVYLGGIDTATAMTMDMAPLLRASGQQLLENQAARVEEMHVPVETALFERLQGRICDQVTDEASRWRADLLVLGTHGRHGLGRVLLGSDAEQIARQAPCPVLLVREVRHPEEESSQNRAG